ncbi:MAG TPA: hypothetical protein VGO67_22740 [Verrucomicrobiae bacterium]|jgi:hypothetical protein
MIKKILLALAIVGFCVAGRAAVLPAEKILPKDTALVITAPDWPKAWAFFANSSYGHLWQDPAMRPYKEKFLEKFRKEAIEPLQQSLGIRFSDYTNLAQGEAIFALVPVAEKENPDQRFAKILIIDSKDQASQLKTNLASINKKWIDAGKAIKTQKIREVEFTTLIASPSDISFDKLFPKPKSEQADDSSSKQPEKNTEITFGQIDSVLFVSDSAAAIEKVLALQQGGLLAPLGDDPSFQADFEPRLHGSPFYCWINVKSLVDAYSAMPTSSDDDSSSSFFKLSTLINAVGLGSVTSACLSYQDSPEGAGAQFFIGAPESKRSGLLKILTPETKDANPPPFVPADVSKFWRWRVNIPRSWALLEAMLNKLNPQANRVLDYVFQNAGKDKDEHYNLKSELLSNLGDDVICYEKPSHGGSFATLRSPPSIYLIGSPNSSKLASALSVAFSALGQGSGGVKDREFLGRTIHTVTMGAPDGQASSSFNFSGSGGYVAVSSDVGILEEYLRSSGGDAKSLMDAQSLGDAGQHVGGLSTGWFGYDNQAQSMRASFDLLRKQRPTVTDILGTPAIAGNLNVPEQIVTKLLDWSDFSLLPPFDGVSKYFYYSVYAGRFSQEGFTLKIFAPTPPALR